MKEGENKSLSLLILRNNAGIPPSDEVKGLLTNRHKPSRADYQNVIHAVREERERLSREGQTVSSLRLITDFIDQNWGKTIVQAAQKASARGDKRLFRFFFDTSMGLRNVLRYLINVEEKSKSIPEDYMVKAVAMLGELGLSLSDQINTFMMNTRNIDVGVSLLKEDPSGFAVLDSFQKGQARAEPAQLEPYSKEYLLYGTGIAIDFYKVVYTAISSN